MAAFSPYQEESIRERRRHCLCYPQSPRHGRARHSSAGANMLNTAAQGVEMCKRIDAPNAKVHLDVYHMNIEESDIASAIMQTGKHIGYFHTGDSHRGYMGSGTIDLASVFRALVNSGYQ